MNTNHSIQVILTFICCAFTFHHTALSHNVNVKSTVLDNIYYIIQDIEEYNAETGRMEIKSYAEVAGFDLNLPNIVVPDSTIRIMAAVPYEDREYPVEVVCSGAFHNREDISTVVLPESIRRIEEDAFKNCSNLRIINAPSGIEQMFSGFLSGTAWMNSQPDGLVLYGTVALTWKGEKEPDATLEIPMGVTLIAKGCFSQAILHELRIPVSVRHIHDTAVGRIERLYIDCEEVGECSFYNNQWLQEVEFGSHTTRIADYAFQGCTQLERITTVGNINNIAPSAFNGTTWVAKLARQETGIFYVDHVAYRYCGAMPEDDALTVKDGTVQIAAYCFRNQANLSHITIPETVMQIDKYAFYGCSKLNEVYLPSSLQFLGSDVFGGRDQIDIHVGSLQQWLDINHLSVSCPYQLFVNGGVVSELVLPEGNQQVPSGAFENCQSITSVSVPSSVGTISYRAFKHCNNLCGVTLQEGLEEIGNVAFQDCIKLTSLTMPSTLKRMGYRPFNGCTNLYSLIMLATEPPIYTEAVMEGEEAQIFQDELVGHCALYVPQGSKSRYENSPAWARKFKYIVEFNPDDLTAIRDLPAQPSFKDSHKSSILNPQSSIYYDLSGRRLSAPPSKGMYIQDKRVKIRE